MSSGASHLGGALCSWVRRLLGAPGRPRPHPPPALDIGFHSFPSIGFFEISNVVVPHLPACTCLIPSCISHWRTWMFCVRPTASLGPPRPTATASATRVGHWISLVCSTSHIPVHTPLCELCLCCSCIIAMLHALMKGNMKMM